MGGQEVLITYKETDRDTDGMLGTINDHTRFPTFNVVIEENFFYSLISLVLYVWSFVLLITVADSLMKSCG